MHGRPVVVLVAVGAATIAALAACRSGTAGPGAHDAAEHARLTTIEAPPPAAAAPPAVTLDSGVFFEYQVERPVTVRFAPPPSYPDELKAAGVEGDVLVQFVVDTLGLAEMRSYRVLRSTNAAFDQAVKEVLPRMRFVPARLRGHAVRQFVQLPFNFALAH